MEIKIMMNILSRDFSERYLRWTRRDVFIHINSITNNTKIGKNLVQEASHLHYLGVGLFYQLGEEG